MSKERERKIVISLHQKGEDDLTPHVETVGEVDDFEYLFAISALSEKFADTDNSRLNPKDQVVEMIAGAVAGGVHGKVDVYINRFLEAIKELRDRKLLEMIDTALTKAGVDITKLEIGKPIVLKKEEDDEDEG